MSLAENSTGVTVVNAVDAGGSASAPSYRIVGGADAALFTVDQQTGELRFVAAPDHELPTDAGADNVYDLVVQASEGQRHATQDLSVTVLNLNDNAPVIRSNGGGSQASVELLEGVTVVTLVSATDADGPLSRGSMAIVGGADAALFTLDPTTGELRFVQAPAYRPAGDNHYEVVIGVSDGERSAQQWISIQVTSDRPPPPPPVPWVPEPPEPPETPETPAPGAPGGSTTPGTPAEGGDGDGDGGGTPALPGRPGQPDPSPSRVPVEVAPVPGLRPDEPLGPVGSDAPAQAGALRWPAAWELRAVLSSDGAASVPNGPTSDELAPAEALRLPAAAQALPASEQAVANTPAHLQAETQPEGELNPELGSQDVAIVGSLAATAGALVWASRGAALVASLMISAPAWRGYDLLPVLRRHDKRQDDEPVTDASADRTAQTASGHALGTAAADAAVDHAVVDLAAPHESAPAYLHPLPSPEDGPDSPGSANARPPSALP